MASGGRSPYPGRPGLKRKNHCDTKLPSRSPYPGRPGLKLIESTDEAAYEPQSLSRPAGLETALVVEHCTSVAAVLIPAGRA